MKKKVFEKYIKDFNFKELFIDLGWDDFNNKLAIAVNDEAYELTGIVQKKGFVIMHCSPGSDGQIPPQNVRKQIERKLTKNYFEHLIIYTDKDKTRQIWQFVIKEENKPKQTREITWHNYQDVEILFQRLKNLLFTIDEEEKITLVDVKARVSENLAVNTEKVTKKFYAEFKKQHTAFLDFIQGIDDHIANKENKNKQWYASLMLNRLMFCYFIQKKGFLNRDTNYMQHKLQESKQLEGNHNFYSFYRSFLLELFHDGLGKPKQQRHQHPIDLGEIPYLNGGLFDVHELEKQFDSIEIEDEAFEKIFDFFDKWNWHLDTNIEATGRDINPDVIGYIFEKYINDRAAMGAYYTKEDITEYISKNTIIPFLFDETERHYKKAFKPGSELWNFLKNSGDTYIYEAVKKGIPENKPLFDDLPEKIKEGFKPELEQKIVVADERPHLWEIRKEWNRKAPSEIALPTEIYRELIERRKRYAAIKSKIVNGQISHINDFITYNLNIRQFAQDFIESTSDAGFIKHFYKALQNITVLDPTAGSGAFLFAAMNILEPLYEACIMRMEHFTEEEPGKHKFFEEVLQEVNSEQHPNLNYYIYKSIILHNLYGVDIMKEAVEIAKLRLFLKLVATVDVNARKPNFGLEPLPDIDFNIRAGNTLVGFATEDELLETIRKTEALFAEEKLEQFKEEFELVSKAYKHFQNAQLVNNQGSDNFKQAKAELNRRLKALNQKLNHYLATNYGITQPETTQKQKYLHWLETHQPFHWFAEFYDIINGKGGFDVIIGNPPYVVYKSSKFQYNILGLKTLPSKNLYSFIIERSLKIIRSLRYFGMIIPLTAISNNNMLTLRELLYEKMSIIYLSNYEIRPAKLFEGVDQRLSIILGKIKKDETSHIFSTSILRWNSDYRRILFDNINYIQSIFRKRFLRFSNSNEQNILNKYDKENQISQYLSNKKNNNSVSYRTAGARYWIIFLNKQIKTFSLSNKTAFFIEEISSKIICAALNSNIYWWYYATNFDMFNIKDYMIFSFKFNYKFYKSLERLSITLENDLEKNKIVKYTQSKTRGEVLTYIYQKKLSKPIIDEIDTVLAEHYGFTEEELDFIINYDIKYRMGKELEAYIDGSLGQQPGEVKTLH